MNREEQVRMILSRNKPKPWLQIIKHNDSITTGEGETISQQELEKLQNDPRVNLIIREIINTD